MTFSELSSITPAIADLISEVQKSSDQTSQAIITANTSSTSSVYDINKLTISNLLELLKDDSLSEGLREKILEMIFRLTTETTSVDAANKRFLADIRPTALSSIISIGKDVLSTLFLSNLTLKVDEPSASLSNLTLKVDEPSVVTPITKTGKKYVKWYLH